MTQPAAWRRIRRLREAGILDGRLRLDNAVFGFGVTVFLGIRLATKGRTSLDEFERTVSAIPKVQLVQQVLGQFDTLRGWMTKYSGQLSLWRAH